MPANREITTATCLLALLGLIPFYITLLAMFLAPPIWEQKAVIWMVLYSLVIISFMAGSHWGIQDKTTTTGTFTDM